jgi:hypothetical protein
MLEESELVLFDVVELEDVRLYKWRTGAEVSAVGGVVGLLWCDGEHRGDVGLGPMAYISKGRPSYECSQGIRRCWLELVTAHSESLIGPELVACSDWCSFAGLTMTLSWDRRVPGCASKDLKERILGIDVGTIIGCVVCFAERD